RALRPVFQLRLPHISKTATVFPRAFLSPAWNPLLRMTKHPAHSAYLPALRNLPVPSIVRSVRYPDKSHPSRPSWRPPYAQTPFHRLLPKTLYPLVSLVHASCLDKHLQIPDPVPVARPT